MYISYVAVTEGAVESKTASAIFSANRLEIERMFETPLLPIILTQLALAHRKG